MEHSIGFRNRKQVRKTFENTGDLHITLIPKYSMLKMDLNRQFESPNTAVSGSAFTPATRTQKHVESVEANVPVQKVGPYSKHLPALDGVRGLAIIGVVCSHLFPGTPGPGLVQQSIHIILEFGAAGVDLFFTLSGFLITGILFDSLQDHHYFRKFYARRALRIFPLYYGTLLVLLILTPWLGIHWHGYLWSLALYLQNTSIAVPLYALTSPLTVGHFWSLAVEEQFYLVWPFVVFFIRDVRKLLWVCLAISCVSFTLRCVLILHNVPLAAVRSNTLCRADALLSGAALALAVRTQAHATMLRTGRWIFATGAAGVALLYVIASRLTLSPAQFACSFSILCSLSAATTFGLIDWSLSASSAARFFQIKPLRFMGKYSYGIYVLHLILFSGLEAVLHKMVMSVTSNKAIVILVSGIIGFVLTVLMAYASYNLYEKPFLRLKRYFDYS